MTTVWMLLEVMEIKENLRETTKKISTESVLHKPKINFLKEFWLADLARVMSLIGLVATMMMI